MDNYNKYLSLKKQMIQKGGTIREIYQYLEKNTRHHNYTQNIILQEYADSLLISNPNITLSEFISNVNTLYDISLPTMKQREYQPIEEDLLSFDIPQSNESDLRDQTPIAKRVREYAATATASADITVYTTGLAYFSIDRIEFVRALIENIIETCHRAGRTVRFIHFDMFVEPIPRYYRDERFIRGYLTLDIIKAEIENNPNALLVDLAHIIHYYHQSNKKLLMKYYSYEDTISSQFDYSSKNLNINCFYTGFLGDMESMNFIRLFRFFQFQGNNIITWIQKGIERNIKIRHIYKGDTTTFCDFTIHKIDLTGLIANIRSPQELNDLFWS
jgi:hypothetical protein